MKMCRVISLWLAMVGLAGLSMPANAQAPAAVRPAANPAPPPELTYVRPTEKIKLRNYFFDSFGPYPILGAAFAAGINQADSTPQSGNKGQRAMASGSGPISPSQQSAPQPAMPWHKPSVKIPCTTAASAKDCFRAWATP